MFKHFIALLVVALICAPQARAVTYDLVKDTDNSNTIIAVSEGPVNNPQVATKNKISQYPYNTDPYGMSFAYINITAGLPAQSLRDLKNLKMDLSLRDGSFSGSDAFVINWFDTNNTYHEIRAYLSALFSNTSQSGWLTTPNAVDSTTCNKVWIDFTDNTYKCWSEITTQYPNAVIASVFIALDNPNNNYYLDNLVINDNSWIVPEPVITTPTTTPTMITTPNPTSIATPTPIGGPMCDVNVYQQKYKACLNLEHRNDQVGCLIDLRASYIDNCPYSREFLDHIGIMLQSTRNKPGK